MTIIYSQVGFYWRDEDNHFQGEYLPKFITKEILEALEAMAAYYTDLDFKGYYDEETGRFIVEHVVNNVNGRELTGDEISEMVYISFNPEQVKVKDVETGIILDVEL